jgi:hypothetical protein
VTADVVRMIAGTGGPVGLTTDGRSVALTAGSGSAAGWANPLGAGTFPVFRFGWAPAGLATRRQLAACGLRPGGAEPVARVEWRAGRRWADLYLVAVAKPKRPMTPARARALDAAMRARRTCPHCGHDVGYVIPRSWPVCWDCQAGIPASQHHHDDPAADSVAA